ncbi:MAG: sulfite exporter TauE/SafE family protein [Solirubrobacterales bacterium]|nr:sulfite exporter TauE/SafE family protein [Solirubrobacterales bacterium]
MISPLDAVVLVAAGVLAGLIGTAGAITSLVSYPALLAVGVPALSANVANLVALLACWPGSALASGPELRGQGYWLRRFVPVAAAGGALGAALLLSTPADAFARIVPFLVAAGSITLLLAPRLTPDPARRVPRRRRPWLGGAVLAVSIYNGYFGAGAGVTLLALLLVTVDDSLPVANALKNMLIGAATILSALGFVLFGHVAWAAVAPLAVGEFVGSILGPRVTRRVPARILRPTVAVIGVGLAVQLFLSHGG